MIPKAQLRISLLPRQVLLAAMILGTVVTLVFSLLYYYRFKSEYDDRLNSIVSGVLPRMENALGLGNIGELETMANILLLQTGVKTVCITQNGEEVMTLGARKSLQNEKRLQRFVLYDSTDGRMDPSAELILAEDLSPIIVNSLRIALLLGFVQSFLLLCLSLLGSKFLGKEFAGLKQKEDQQDADIQDAFGVMNDTLQQNQVYLQTVLEDRDRRINMLENEISELQRYSYSVSHDLKSPLVTMSGFLELLETDLQDQNNELVDRDLMRIGEAVDKMKRLLDDLQKLSLFSHSVKAASHVSFHQVLEHVLKLMEPRIRKKQAQVVIDNTLPQVLMDESWLKELLINLIDNALIFSGTEPLRIHIGCSDIKDRTDSLRGEFYIRDNGMGVDAKYQEQIFRLFEKLNAGTDGSGVGLTLVRRIVEKFSGQVVLESEGEGSGSTVRFDLPLESNHN